MALKLEKMYQKIFFRETSLLFLLITLGLPVLAAPRGLSAEPDSTDRDLLQQTEMTFEWSGTVASGDFAPLWLSANRYGLGSVEAQSIYERARMERSILHDEGRKWRIGYGLDAALTFGHERHVILQQAYVEGAWRCLRLTVGAKQQKLEMQNNELSSGALTYGINARPIPQIRLDVDWFSFPGTRGWWQWTLHGSYGLKTDGPWQEEWVADGTRYTRHSLYHEKALHWQFGRPDIFPLTYEIGLNMAAEFGGTSYGVVSGRYQGTTTFKHSSNLRSFWNALICSGSDATDGSDPNVEGNHLGSWVMQLKYHGHRWQARAYWERFFEDHSQLTVQYGIHDMLIGAEVTLPHNRIVSSVVFEYLGTTDQTGPILHDPTPFFPLRIAGRDDYYNNLNYSGWQNYGHTMGNPLITSPLYNAALNQSNHLRFYNNRIHAWHAALAGDPSSEWHWRALFSFSHNWGTYDYPFTDMQHQAYAMAEATYRPRWAEGWTGVAALALDHGQLLGNSFGGQLTIRKTLNLK